MRIPFVWFALLLVANSVQASTVTIAPPPSQSASFTITITNNGSATVAQPSFLLSRISSSVGALSVAEPCQLLAGPLDLIWEIRGPTLALGESRTCDVTFARSASTPINSFMWRPSPSPTSTGVALTPSTWAVGVFQDPSISVEPVLPLPFPGATEALFRITVTNPGSIALTDVEAGSCQIVSSNMAQMDTDIPGGCGTMVHPYLLCFGGQVDFGVGFSDLSAGAQSSCLVRARRASGLVAGTGWSFDLYHASDSPTADGYLVGDSNPDNNSANAVVGFFDTGHAIPAGRAGAFLALMAAVFSLALIRIRRERQVSTNGVSP